MAIQGTAQKRLSPDLWPSSAAPWVEAGRSGYIHVPHQRNRLRDLKPHCSHTFQHQACWKPRFASGTSVPAWIMGVGREDRSQEFFAGGSGSHEMILQRLETPSSVRQPSSLQKPPSRAGSHAGFSLCGPPPSASPLRPGRKRARCWTVSAVWFPQTPELGWRGTCRVGGSVRPEGGWGNAGPVWGPSPPCVPGHSLEPMEQRGRRVPFGRPCGQKGQDGAP